MQVMHLSLVSKEIIATVNSGGIEQLPSQVNPKRKHMAPQKLGRQRNRKRIGEDLLDGMRELGSERDGSREPVVLLVDAAVEVWHV